MRHQPKPMTDASADSGATLGCCHPRLRRRPAVGLGSGDRFGVSRGGSGAFREGVLQAEKPAGLQGKRATKRFSQSNWQRGETSMVRRGSPVRVRKRAYLKYLQISTLLLSVR